LTKCRHVDYFLQCILNFSSNVTTLRSPYVIANSSVCRCCTLLRQLFGNIFAPSISVGNWAVCIKILEKIKGVLGDRASSMEGGMKNWRFSTNIVLYFRNDTKYGHSYNGRRIELVCDVAYRIDS